MEYFKCWVTTKLPEEPRQTLVLYIREEDEDEARLAAWNIVRQQHRHFDHVEKMGVKKITGRTAYQKEIANEQ